MTNGVLDFIENIQDYEYETISGGEKIEDNFPKSFQLKPYTVKNQGWIMACVGCATATMLEAQFNEEFSEGWDYGRLRNDDENFRGMIHTRTLDYLRKIGGIPKKDFDILKEMPDMKEICEKFPELDEKAKQFKISAYVKLDNGDTRTGQLKDLQIKKCITETQKPLFAISPRAFGQSHAIVILGWNDEKNQYIIQNSWGLSYGNNGVGSVKKEDICQVYQFIYEPVKLPFNDVTETDWFYNSIKSCYMAGLIKGKTETEFAPQDYLTRAESCVKDVRLMKKIDTALQTLSKIMNIKIDTLTKLINTKLGE